MAQEASNVWAALKNLAHDIKQYPLLVGGIALLCAWTRIAFGSSLYDPPLLLGITSGVPYMLLVALGGMAGCLFMGVLGRTPRFVAKGRAYHIAITLATVIGCCLCCLTRYGSAPWATRVSAFGIALIGMGAVLICVEWGRVLGFLGFRRAVAVTSVGFIGAAVIFLALGILPTPVQWLYLIGAPVGFMAIVSTWVESTSPKALCQGGSTDFCMPWRLIATVTIVGIAFGVGTAVNGMGNYLAEQFTREATTLFTVALAFLLTVVQLKINLNQLIYRVSIPIVAAGCLLLALFGGTSALGRVGGFCSTFGICFLEMLVIALCTHIIKNLNVSAERIVTPVVGSLLLGRALGILTIQALQSTPGVGGALGLSTEIAADVLVVLAFALMLCALLFVDSQNIKIGWGTIRPTSIEPSIDLSSSCNTIGADYGLTPRETEVLILLARGYSRETISKNLTISKETARTHTANIFKKLGVHSHQELIALVEDQAKLLDGQQPPRANTAYSEM